MSNIVGRGYVVAFERDGVRKITAVVPTLDQAVALKKRVGGVIHKVAGHTFRRTSDQMRVLTTPVHYFFKNN